MLPYVYAIEQLAKKELAAEEKRAAIDRAKERIRARRNRPWWSVVFPFRIRIERINPHV